MIRKVNKTVVLFFITVTSVLGCSTESNSQNVKLMPEIEELTCTPGYQPCLPPASDYDCIGGTGNGPKYTSKVFVTGEDVYSLDRDGNGIGCEN